jgi:uncharacterized DUF497 family protein
MARRYLNPLKLSSYIPPLNPDYYKPKLQEKKSSTIEFLGKFGIRLRLSSGTSLEGKILSPDQLHYPPYRRYWKVGKTRQGKLLLVAWEVWREEKNLISAYPPSEGQVKVYEAKIKKYKV